MGGGLSIYRLLQKRANTTGRSVEFGERGLHISPPTPFRLFSVFTQDLTTSKFRYWFISTTIKAGNFACPPIQEPISLTKKRGFEVRFSNTRVIKANHDLA